MPKETLTMRASDNSIVKLEYHKRLLSASELAKQYAKMGYPDRYVVISEYEKKRGSDKKGLYMSCVLRPSFFPSHASLLSSLATVSLVTALSEHTTKKLGIGWVSNVYCEGKHIGGVNIEGKLDNYTSFEYIIVSFFVSLSETDFPPRLTDLVRKIFVSENTSIAVIIAKNILNKFFHFYSSLRNSEKFMNLYRQHFLLHGAKIKRLVDGKKISCKVLGINHEDCSLIIENKKGDIESITSPSEVIIPKKIKQKRA